MTPVFTLNYRSDGYTVYDFTVFCTNTTLVLKSLFLLLINCYTGHTISGGDDKTTLLCKIPTNRLLLPLTNLPNLNKPTSTV